MNSTKNVKIYTDGSAIFKNGGWAYIITGTNKILADCGSVKNTTNNRMEMEAAINGINRYINSSQYNNDIITIISDSIYLVNGLNRWMYKWSRKGFKINANADRNKTKNKRKSRFKKKDKLSNNNPKVMVDRLNADLWRQLHKLAFSHNINAEWVKGHAGDKYNDMCDKLANNQARILYKNQ